MSKVVQTNGLTGGELAAFARQLSEFDNTGLQVEGEVCIEGVGSMSVTFNGDQNVVTTIEGIE